LIAIIAHKDATRKSILEDTEEIRMTYIKKEESARWIMAFYAAYGLFELVDPKANLGSMISYIVENNLVAAFTMLTNTCAGLTNEILIKTLSNKNGEKALNAFDNEHVNDKYRYVLLNGKPVIDTIYNDVQQIIHHGILKKTPQALVVPKLIQEWVGNPFMWDCIKKPKGWVRPERAINTLAESSRMRKIAKVRPIDEPVLLTLAKQYLENTNEQDQELSFDLMNSQEGHKISDEDRILDMARLIKKKVPYKHPREDDLMVN
jgi:hypothetical protein